MKPLLYAFLIGWTCSLTPLDKEPFQALHEELRVPPKEHALRLLTWNVQKQIKNEERLDDILQDLKKINADIIAFQEAFQNHEVLEDRCQEIPHEWEASLAALSYRVIKCYPCQTDPSGTRCHLKNQCLACITNQEILSSHCHIFPKSLQHVGWDNTQFGFQEVLLNTHLGKIYVINVHLIPGGDGKKRKEQIAMLLHYIYTHLDSDIPIFILGDYNSLNYRQIAKNGQLQAILQQDISREVSTPLYELEALYQAGFQEVYDKGKEEAPWVTTWSLRRVDYIFTKNDRDFITKPLLFKRVHSDHFPLAVDIVKNPIE